MGSEKTEDFLFDHSDNRYNIRLCFLPIEIRDVWPSSNFILAPVAIPRSTTATLPPERHSRGVRPTSMKKSKASSTTQLWLIIKEILTSICLHASWTSNNFHQ